MASTEIEIRDEVGLHARPAARFVQLAGSFAATVTVTKGERTADARSLLEILQLEAGRGSKVTIEASGEDAEDALAALSNLLSGVEA